MKRTLFILLLLTGCASRPLSTVKDDTAHERAMLRAIVEQRNELGCEAFESLVVMQVISMEADSIMENTYYK